MLLISTETPAKRMFIKKMFVRSYMEIKLLHVLD